MDKKDQLLRMLIESSTVMGKNNGEISFYSSRANNPILENSATILAEKIKRMGTFNWVYGNIEEYPVLLKKVSMLLNNAKLYFPRGVIDVPASLSPFEDNNIIITRVAIRDSDVREVINFCKNINEKPVDRVAIVTLFDCRKRLQYPGINIESVFQRKDLNF